MGRGGTLWRAPVIGIVNAKPVRTWPGARIFLFHGRDLADRWQQFIATDLPTLENAGWQIEIAAEFGTRPVEAGSEWQADIADTQDGWFSLDMGIEVEGQRVSLLPILVRLLERGGIEGMPVTDGRVHAPLDNGRLVALPAQRVGKLLAIIAEITDAGRLTAADAMVLPAAEGASVIDLEPLATTRWENAAAIRDYARKLQGGGTPPRVPPPPAFAAALRPYQQQGLDWRAKAPNKAAPVAQQPASEMRIATRSRPGCSRPGFPTDRAGDGHLADAQRATISPRGS